MRLSFNWLRELVTVPDDATVLGDRLTMAGLALDAIEQSKNDSILELDITANRGDCLSHWGVAREVGVIYDRKISLPEFLLVESEPRVDTALTISIVDTDLCSRYCGRYIEDVRIQPSPDWMAERLQAVGVRPVNNVADITNYVLMELGQPLHAFDADKLTDNTIIVRRAETGERFQTLDGKERTLESSMLVIADSDHTVALAGVMGGDETEISDSTRNIVLESAWFDPQSVRKTARHVNLSTEASYRFERGADIEMTRFACDRAAQLIQELAGGRVRAGVVDVFPKRTARPEVRLRRRRMLEYLGMEVEPDIVVRILTRLGFEVTENLDGLDVEGWVATVPSHRHDISREEDLLEEIARHHGYDRFPSTLPSFAGQGQRLPWHKEETAVRDVLAGLGYSETCSLAFSNEELERKFAPEIEPVVIRNPLSEDRPVMRTSLVPSMLRSIEWNLNRGRRDLLLYEIGKVYPRDGERLQLLMATTGNIRPQTVHSNHLESSFYDLKGAVEELLDQFDVESRAESGNLPSYYHPGRSVRLGSPVRLGELDPDYGDLFKLHQEVYLAEVDLEKLYELRLRKVAAAPIPKYPAIRRDLSLLLDRRIRYAHILSAVQAAGIRELVHVEPFDKLDEGPFPASCYSIAIGLLYQSEERTLTDQEVQDFERRVLGELEAIGAKLRS